MYDSLSIILPVHNAQATLAKDVHRLLDVIPELTGRFEALVIDDGSNDGTEEVAWELMMHYPQVDFVRHPYRTGLRDSLRTAYEMTSGQFLLIHVSGRVDVEQMVQLWRQRDELPAIDDVQVTDLLAIETSPPQPRWIRRRVSWRRILRLDASDSAQPPRMQLLRRSHLCKWLLDATNDADVAARQHVKSRTFNRHRPHGFPTAAPPLPQTGRVAQAAASDWPVYVAPE